MAKYSIEHGQPKIYEILSGLHFDIYIGFQAYETTPEKYVLCVCQLALAYHGTLLIDYKAINVLVSIPFTNNFKVYNTFHLLVFTMLFWEDQ